jgi:hypothetical protein
MKVRKARYAGMPHSGRSEYSSSESDTAADVGDVVCLRDLVDDLEGEFGREFAGNESSAEAVSKGSRI